MNSKGGTSEDWDSNSAQEYIFWGKNKKKISRSSLRYPDPHLDKIRSALTVYEIIEMNSMIFSGNHILYAMFFIILIFSLGMQGRHVNTVSVDPPPCI